MMTRFDLKERIRSTYSGYHKAVRLTAHGRQQMLASLIVGAKWSQMPTFATLSDLLHFMSVCRYSSHDSTALRPRAPRSMPRSHAPDTEEHSLRSVVDDIFRIHETDATNHMLFMHKKSMLAQLPRNDSTLENVDCGRDPATRQTERSRHTLSLALKKE